jgi:hypothetical protein
MKLGHSINEAFGHVYVKNIPEATTRLQSFVDSAAKVDLQYEVFKAIRGDQYVPPDYIIKYRPELYTFPWNQYLVGNYCTSMAILLDAMRNNYDSYVICDDDVIFYDKDFPSIAESLPSDWDIIILGQMSKTSEEVHGRINMNYVRVRNYDLPGCHCIAFNKRLYWKQLHNYMGFDSHGRFGDVTVGDMSLTDVNVYYISPNICYQERVVLKPYTIH